MGDPFKFVILFLIPEKGEERVHWATMLIVETGTTEALVTPSQLNLK